MSNESKEKLLSQSHLEHFVQDIESTEGPLGPTFRAIFDTGNQKHFLELLQSRIKTLDRDIEKLCGHYYQGFTESIHELPHIRNDMNKLKTDLSSTNMGIQSTGRQFNHKLEDGIHYENISNNIDIAIGRANMCIPVLGAYIKLQQQLQDKRYYAALKTLEILENFHLPRLTSPAITNAIASSLGTANTGNFSLQPQVLENLAPGTKNNAPTTNTVMAADSNTFQLAKALKHGVADIRANIKKASEAELRDFLEVIRQRSTYIGKMAMRNQALRSKFINLDSVLSRVRLRTRFHDPTSKIFHPIPMYDNLTVNAAATHTDKTFNNDKTHDVGAHSQESDNYNPFEEGDLDSNSPSSPPKIVSGNKNVKPTSRDRKIDDKSKNNMNINHSPHTNDVHESSNMDLSTLLDQGIDPSKLVDFSPLYRCLHINTILGHKDNFIDYYRKQREKQIKLIFQPSHNQINESLELYQSYLYDIAGFFLVENYIMSSTKKSGLVDKAYLDELWTSTTTKSISLLKTKSAYCTDTMLLMELKNLIVLFYLTLREYGYPVNRIYELLIEIREQYHEILRMQMVQLFRTTLSRDDYAPLTCKSSESLRPYFASDDQFFAQFIPQLSITNQAEHLEKLKYPYYFPFSRSLPVLFDHIRTFILTCYTFSQDLPNIGSTELDDALRKAVLNLLARSLTGCISAAIKAPELQIEQLIQISVNVDYLEKYMFIVDGTISQITRTSNQSIKIAGIFTQSIIKEIKDEIGTRLQNDTARLIEQILSNAKFDWMCNNQLNQPSSFILQLEDAFQKHLLSYPNTKEVKFQATLDFAFETLSNALLQFLTAPEKVKMVSLPSLQNYQFNLADLIETFNDTISQNEALKSLNLFRHFREINQLLNLIIKLDWATYITEFGKSNSVYSLVPSKLATQMLEKLMMGERQRENVLTNMMPSNHKRVERKKFNETLLKQLKQIQLIEPTHITLNNSSTNNGLSNNVNDSSFSS